MSEGIRAMSRLYVCLEGLLQSIKVAGVEVGSWRPQWNYMRRLIRLHHSWRGNPIACRPHSYSWSRPRSQPRSLRDIRLHIRRRPTTATSHPNK